MSSICQFVIEVVGTCNLRCPSCPVGNTEAENRPAGLMSPDLFERILNKIQAEGHLPQQTQLSLFNWGEPLLHPDLPKMIRLARSRGFQVFLSSNLNGVVNLSDVVAASPNTLRISTSGYFQDTYHRTHRGGQVNLVKSNMHLLRHYMDACGASFEVEVLYHMYRHNMGADFQKMRGLAEDLGYRFKPVWAYLMPLEKLLAFFGGRLASEDRALLDLLVIGPGEAREIAERHRQEFIDCTLRRDQLVINHDGSVPLCCAVYSQANVVKDFLDEPESRIQEQRYRNPVCNECMAHSVHLTAIYAGELELNNAGIRILSGPT